MAGQGPAEREKKISRKVLVVGDGSASQALVRDLLDRGCEVMVVPTHKPPERHGPSEARHVAAGTGTPVGDSRFDARSEVLVGAEIKEFRGSPGRFQVNLGLEGKGGRDETVGAIVLTLDCEAGSPFPLWGLRESNRVVSLSALEAALASSSPIEALKGDGAATCVCLCGFTHDSHPLSQKRAIAACLQIMEQGARRVICLVEDFKVAEQGMERLTLEARKRGVLFVKLGGGPPEIESREGRWRVTYYDGALGGKVGVDADLVVLEEPCRPARATAHLSEVLGVELDRHGFFQGDNVYHLPIFTNRTGIWVVGSGKGPLSTEEALQEAAASALEVSRLLTEADLTAVEDRVQLDRKKCTICLTCYRLCPHRAVSYVDRRPTFSELACRACGICAAECPMDAIQILPFSDGTLKEEIGKGSQGAAILAFCCQNSAYEAARLAKMSGRTLPATIQLIQVPCAGKVDVDYLLSAFRYGAQGVMVLACHHESCKSVEGSLLAQWRVEALHNMLEELGLEKGRLLFRTLAPGMLSDFMTACEEMTQTLEALGPSPIRPSGPPSPKSAAVGDTIDSGHPGDAEKRGMDPHL